MYDTIRRSTPCPCVIAFFLLTVRARVIFLFLANHSIHSTTARRARGRLSVHLYRSLSPRIGRD
jgi:hypothetical protein